MAKCKYSLFLFFCWYKYWRLVPYCSFISRLYGHVHLRSFVMPQKELCLVPMWLQGVWIIQMSLSFSRWHFCFMSCNHKYSLWTSWMTDWLTDWVTDLVTDWLTNKLIDLLTDWLTYWFSECLSVKQPCLKFLSDWNLFSFLSLQLLLSFNLIHFFLRFFSFGCVILLLKATNFLFFSHS